MSLGIMSQKPRIALVSANFGLIDEPRQIPESSQIRTHYYFDSQMPSAESVSGWDLLVPCDYPRRDWSPRLRSRYFKHQIHRLKEVRDFEYLVWADTSLKFVSLDFISETVELLRTNPVNRRMAIVPHPERKTIEEEYEFITAEIAKGNEYLALRYAEERMSEQMAELLATGSRSTFKLFCGTFWILENSSLYHQFLNDWWDQNLKWGMMDQLSFSPMLEKHQIVPEHLELCLWQNQFFSYVPHQNVLPESPTRI